MEEICKKVASKTNAEMAFVNFVFKDEAVIKAHHGVTDEFITVPVKDSLCTYVASQGKPMVFSDPSTAELLKGCASAEVLTFYAGAPIHFQGQVVGAFGIADTKANHGIKYKKALPLVRLAARDIERMIEIRKTA